MNEEAIKLLEEAKQLGHTIRAYKNVNYAVPCAAIEKVIDSVNKALSLLREKPKCPTCGDNKVIVDCPNCVDAKDSICGPQPCVTKPCPKCGGSEIVPTPPNQTGAFYVKCPTCQDDAAEFVAKIRRQSNKLFELSSQSTKAVLNRTADLIEQLQSEKRVQSGLIKNQSNHIKLLQSDYDDAVEQLQAKLKETGNGR